MDKHTLFHSVSDFFILTSISNLPQVPRNDKPHKFMQSLLLWISCPIAAFSLGMFLKKKGGGGTVNHRTCMFTRENGYYFTFAVLATQCIATVILISNETLLLFFFS